MKKLAKVLENKFVAVALGTAVAIAAMFTIPTIDKASAQLLYQANDQGPNGYQNGWPIASGQFTNVSTTSLAGAGSTTNLNSRIAVRPGYGIMLAMLSTGTVATATGEVRSWFNPNVDGKVGSIFATSRPWTVTNTCWGTNRVVGFLQITPDQLRNVDWIQCVGYTNANLVGTNVGIEQIRWQYWTQ